MSTIECLDRVHEQVEEHADDLDYLVVEERSESRGSAQLARLSVRDVPRDELLDTVDAWLERVAEDEADDEPVKLRVRLYPVKGMKALSSTTVTVRGTGEARATLATFRDVMAADEHLALRGIRATHEGAQFAQELVRQALATAMDLLKLQGAAAQHVTKHLVEPLARHNEQLQEKLLEKDREANKALDALLSLRLEHIEKDEQRLEREAERSQIAATEERQQDLVEGAVEGFLDQIGTLMSLHFGVPVEVREVLPVLLNNPRLRAALSKPGTIERLQDPQSLDALADLLELEGAT